jgi:hypothetical protein
MTRSTIDSTKSRRSFRTAVAWALVFLLFAHSGAASQEDCEVIAKDGETRECTFTEELADCALDAQDSWEQCMDAADGFLDRLGCEITTFVDNAACVVSVPVSWGLGRMFD